ncbi:MAG: TauD/TfdA family dioxygenase [Polyangiaceae bacterium]
MPRAYNSVTLQTLHYLIRPHTELPTGPVSGPAAWRGDELAVREDWLDQLNDDDVAELEAALAFAKGTRKPLAELSLRDFPLPGLQTKLRHWRRAVHEGSGVQVVRGLPVDRWSQADAELVFWALGQHLGTPGAQNQREELLGHVKDQGVSYDAPDVRGYQTSAALNYHCDAADAVGLLCLKTAKCGGQSRFVSSVSVWNRLWEEHPGYALRLFETFHFDTRGDGGLDFFPIEPCRYSNGKLRTFYHGDYFRTAEQHPGAPPLSLKDRELLDAYDAIANEPGMYLEYDFAPGDIQLLSNHTVLHARTDYEDHPEADNKRHLLRLWLSFDDDRPRPHRSQLTQGARLLGALAGGRARKQAKRSWSQLKAKLPQRGR